MLTKEVHEVAIKHIERMRCFVADMKADGYEADLAENALARVSPEYIDDIDWDDCPAIYTEVERILNA